MAVERLSVEGSPQLKGTNGIRLCQAYGATGSIRPMGPMGQARCAPTLAFIRHKREASSEVLVNDARQNGHDDEEDRD